ncbi:MAG: cob(I)yrinic acid a,c-diamide adenosyltransferase, partial [Nitrosopumilales archaeon]
MDKDSSSQDGIVIVYTGNGKGKTTASLGVALRAIGHGLKVCMVQFIKGEWH